MKFPETIKLTEVKSAYAPIMGRYATGETADWEYVAREFVDGLVSMRSGVYGGPHGATEKHPYTCLTMRCEWIDVRESPGEIRARIEAIEEEGE